MVKVTYEIDKAISSTLILHAVNKNKKKYVDSEQIRIDSSILILYSKVHAINRNKKRKEKYIDSYRRKKWLMCKQKTKKVYRFLQ